MAEKFKSKLREKLKASAKRNEAGGRSLSYGDRTAGKHYRADKGSKDVSVPKRKSYFGQIKSHVKGKIKSANDDAKKAARSILSGKLKGDVEEAHKGLTGIRHPAQLIPAFQKGNTLARIIKSLTNR